MRSVQSVGRRRGGGRVGAAALVRRLVLLVELLDRLDLLLELHAPVLEPDLDLALGEAQRVRHLDPPPPRQVVVRVELLLQFEGLVARVRLPSAASQSVGTFEYCTRREHAL